MRSIRVQGSLLRSQIKEEEIDQECLEGRGHSSSEDQMCRPHMAVIFYNHGVGLQRWQTLV